MIVHSGYDKTDVGETVEAILFQHGFDSIDDAREANVAFGCFECGSIASVTPTEESTREMQRDLIDWSCCDPGNDFRI